MPPITLSKTCVRCSKSLPLSRFPSDKRYRLGKSSWCKPCRSIYHIDRLKQSIRRRLWQSSYVNSRAKGIKHTIKVDDIPRPIICRYLGIRLDYRCASERGRLRSYNAPSIDRIDPTIGYVPGNIQVISDLANRMKQDATVEQLIAFAQGVLRVHGY